MDRERLQIQKNRTIKVKCAVKTNKFKDSKLKNEVEYFIERSNLNPYLYCAGNSVRYVDPDGRNPIFNRHGKFIGVDDWGMQGEAMKMNLGIESIINDQAKEDIIGGI